MKTVPRYLRSARRPEARGVTGEELWWPPTGPAGVVVTEDTALRLPALLAAIVGLAQDVAALPLNVYQSTEDGGRRSAREHPVEELMTRSPDGETTPICWRASFMGHALQRGNGYAEIQRRNNGRPYALHLLDPRTTRPERRDGALGYRLDNVRWLPAGDVLHMAGFGPDGIEGYNFIRLTNESIGVGLASQSYAADYFANGAEPGGLIEHPLKLDPQALENFRQGWDLKHRGPGNRHRPAMLQQGARWVNSTTTPENSQLVETRKFQANDTTRPWRMPPHKYGDFSQAHLANIEASNLDYLQTALMWWLVVYEQQCKLKLFTRAEWMAGYYVEHNVNALLRGDITSRFNAYGKALNDGWMNRDQVRRRENMNPIGKDAGGETYFVPLNMTPLDQAGKSPPAPAAARVERRFNPHHDAAGKFSSGSGWGGGGTVKVAGEEIDPDRQQAIEGQIQRLGQTAGQEWHFEAREPRSPREVKALEKTEATERFLVKEEVRPKSQEVTRQVEGGTHTTHTVGGEVLAETFPNTSNPYDSERWVSRQYPPTHPTPGGYDDYYHPTEKAALRDSRGLARDRARDPKVGYVNYHTPKRLEPFLDEQGASQARRRSPDADTYTHSYTLIHP